MPILNGWHTGELSVQRRLGFDASMATAFTWIDGEMPEQHREFYVKNLPFIPFTILDERQRPWGSIVSGKGGKPGFVSSPNETTLLMDIQTWEGDPMFKYAKLFDGRNNLVAGIGIEFPTRRRNKFAGRLAELKRDGKEIKVVLEVNQAIGNCPKYINVRQLAPHPTKPRVIHDARELSPNDILPAEVQQFIRDADTVFLGTSYEASAKDSLRFPSHVGMNQRGGRQGFMRVSTSDQRTVYLPDYSGNRLLTSLGNIEASHLASLTIVSFTTGDILYLTGVATNLVGEEAQTIMPRQNVLTSISVTGYVMVQDALPVRQTPDSTVQRSPYSPPIKLLKEEQLGQGGLEIDAQATLARVDLHSSNVGTFTWKPSKVVQSQPGQAIALDFTSLFGKTSYRHMAPDNPQSINDDRVRTWTLSRNDDATFSVTLRAKPGGVVTGGLFSIAKKLAQHRPEMLADTTPLGITADVRGVVGEFVLPSTERLLWVAGGIGITPFLRMLSSIGEKQRRDIVLVVSTREPDVLLDLIASAASCSKPPPLSTLRIHVFSHNTPKNSTRNLPGWNAQISFSLGRIAPVMFADKLYLDRTAMVCGPRPFEQDVINGLMRAGMSGVLRENFDY